ncbi:MAG: hypothetical protein M3297_01665 [Thermoproteota archaeon]|jgi:hypothetical protein|nr:hypothetical protein [Thermoproteota archaeon]
MIESHRLQVLGLTDEEILALLNHIKESQTRLRFPIPELLRSTITKELHNQEAINRT